MGKLNFRGYLISQLYPAREICENLMHAKNMFYSNRWLQKKRQNNVMYLSELFNYVQYRLTATIITV